MAIPRKLLGGPQLAAHHSVSPSCHHVVMSSCHHAVKDFCMIHTNKKQGHSSAEDGCPVGYPNFFQSIPVCLGSKEGRGDEGRPPLRALCGSRAAPRRSVGETLELALALLHKLLGGAQLVAHDAQQLLRLLQEIEIDQVHLYHLGAVALLHAVEVLLAHER